MAKKLLDIIRDKNDIKKILFRSFKSDRFCLDCASFRRRCTKVPRSLKLVQDE